MLIGVLACPHAGARAEVTRIDIASRTDVLGGKPFGETGPYENRRQGVLSLDPANPRNKAIVDLDKTPRDAGGACIFGRSLRARSEGRRARQRGGAVRCAQPRAQEHAARLQPRAAAVRSASPLDLGDGFLMQQGYTLVWVGWQFDIPRRGGLMALDAPVARERANQ